MVTEFATSQANGKTLTLITYLNSLKGDIIYVVNHSKQTVRKSNKGPRQQNDEMILIHTHLRITVEMKTKEAVR